MKFIIKIGCIVVSLCSVIIGNTQLTDHHSSFRHIEQNSYFRFHYDNDYFTKSDEYYTQGITIEWVNPALMKNPLSKLLWKPYKTNPQFGIALNLMAHSPTSTASDSILYGDRPYSANISLKTFLIQADPVHQQQVSTALIIGVIGPAALGNEIHTHIHRWLKNPLPRGWQHQIRNDVIVNYQLNYEKQLLCAANHFLVNATAEARLGTLNNKINGGLNFMAGRFNKRFSSVPGKRKTEYYFYGQGRLNLVGYDASLQGGLFNRKSPYTIAGSDISRIIFQADAGIIVNFKKLYFSYTQSFLTKEFRTGSYHRWGGVSIGFSL